MSASSATERLQEELAAGPSAVVDRLVTLLRDEKSYHRLFDALLLREKLALGAPLTRPTAFDDVPSERRDDFEKAYVVAAREVADLLLAEGKLSQAWVYFHAIRELTPLREALDKIVPSREADDRSEELIEVALFKGVHPLKGVETMLKTHGTCSTITALDQQFAQLKSEDRSACAAAMVRQLHGDLMHNVSNEVKQRMPFASPATSLRELVAGRDWLFADSNYHIDVSHLNATVRFARALSADQPELKLARDLAEYGACLASQFQYAGEPPFEEFYPAHQHYFRFLLNEERPLAEAYFRQKLEQEPDAQDQTLIAYVLVDLLVRADRFDEAIPLAEQHLVDADGDFAAAFAELCEKAQRFDALKRSAERRGDLVTFTAALLSQPAGK
jgi:hypothetical protein